MTYRVISYCPNDYGFEYDDEGGIEKMLNVSDYGELVALCPAVDQVPRRPTYLAVFRKRKEGQ